MSVNEKDFLEILESLTVTIASVAVTAEMIVKAIKALRKPDEEDRQADEDER
ncbi:hypothetical protein FACS1894216_02420 [Synergistales bacterium]|nr:hypothetical protein FACS1894216_02420 [Synergistales bacterium]